MMAVPSDACPYRRPFAERFADCPAYEPGIFIATTMRDAPLAPVWACRQMTVGKDKEQPGRLYAKCLIGDAQGRRDAFFARLRGPQQAA